MGLRSGDRGGIRLVCEGSLSRTNKHRSSAFGPAFAKVRLKCSRINVAKKSPVILLHGTFKMTHFPYAMAGITCKRLPPAKSLHPLAVI